MTILILHFSLPRINFIIKNELFLKISFKIFAQIVSKEKLGHYRKVKESQIITEGKLDFLLMFQN